MQERNVRGWLLSFLGDGKEVSSEARAGRKLRPRELMGVGGCGAACRSPGPAVLLSAVIWRHAHMAVHSAWLRGAPITAQEQEQGRNSCKAQTEKVQALLQGAAHRQAENQEDSSAAPSSPTIQPSMRCREGLRANSRSKQGMIST